jgi:transcriptional regulator with XRE-family HTH domain
MDDYGIRGADLSRVTGIGRQHISDIRKGRRWMTEETFDIILKGMEEVSPGSKAYFCRLLAEENLPHPKTLGELIDSFIAVASEDEKEEALLTIARSWRKATVLMR